MKPKEKAKELVKKYACLARGEYYNDWLDKDIVFDYYDCQNALIAVDEVLNKDGYNNDYWQEVKQEIEKL